MQCAFCDSKLNQENPAWEIGCDHKFCWQCIQKNILSNSNSLKCDIDGIICQNPLLNLKISPICQTVNEEKKNNMNLFCKEHSKKIKFLCNIHRNVLCSYCVWDHFDHKNQIKNLNKDVLIQFLSPYEEKLKEIQLKSSAFLSEISNLKAFKEKMDINFLVSELDSFLGIKLSQPEFENYLKAFDFSIFTCPLSNYESVPAIFDSAPNKEFLFKMFLPQKIEKVRLLYRASQNKFSFEEYYKKIFEFKLSPLLILIQTRGNSFFGGFKNKCTILKNNTYYPSNHNEQRNETWQLLLEAFYFP